MLGYRSSSSLFTSLIPHIVAVVQSVRTQHQGDESDAFKSELNLLSAFLFSLLDLHKASKKDGMEDVYDSLTTALQGLPVPSQEQKEALFASYSWDCAGKWNV